MQISEIWVSQRKLRCVAQICAMVQTLEEGSCLPQITLSRSEVGSLRVEDGHHRIVAIWLAGRRQLEEHEYLLLEKDQWRPRFGMVTDLLARCSLSTDDAWKTKNQ